MSAPATFRCQICSMPTGLPRISSAPSGAEQQAVDRAAAFPPRRDLRQAVEGEPGIGDDTANIVLAMSEATMVVEAEPLALGGRRKALEGDDEPAATAQCPRGAPHHLLELSEIDEHIGRD